MKSRMENKGVGQGRLIIPTLLLLMVTAPIIYFLGCHSASKSGNAAHDGASYVPTQPSAPIGSPVAPPPSVQASQYALPPMKHHQYKYNLMYSVQPQLNRLSKQQQFNQQLLRVDPNTAVHQAELDLQEGHNTETYDRIDENKFHSALKDPLSTFSIDVDTASYSNVRRFL